MPSKHDLPARQELSGQEFPGSPAALPREHSSPTLHELLHHGNGAAYRQLVDTIHDYAIFFLTPEGNIASWNPGAQRIKGYRPDEIIGKHFSVFYSSEALAQGWPMEELRRSAAEGRLEDEGWRLRKDGTRFWANVIITPLRGPAGQLLGYFKVTRDLTEKRAQEERLRESERNLRLLVTSVIDYAIYSLDPHGFITGWNLGAQRIKGYTAGEAVGKHFSIFYPPEEAAKGAPQAALMKAAQAAHHESEGWRIRKDGTRLWARITLTAIRDESGLLLGYSKVTRDLTEWRRHEEQLRESEQNLRLLVEGVQDHAMYLLDAGGRIRTWNSGARKLLGYEAHQVLDSHVAMLYVKEEQDAGRPTAELNAVQASGFMRVEGWRQRSDGSRFWADVATTHLQDEEGRSKGFVKLVRDLTERQRVEALESEGRRLSEFIAMLSHELRNPLAPIRNAASLLRQFVDKPEAASCLDVVDRQVSHLKRLVDDLLDVSRITKGKIRLEPAPLEFNTLVRLAVESCKEIVKEHGHTMTMRLSSGPLPVTGDATRLTQLVVNLLNNAAKYTPREGRIEVTVDQTNRFAVLQVADNGIGMTEALLQHAFEPFVQGARALDRADGGLGIGLTLVKTIAELHGGTVTAASAGTGKGAVFTVTLPFAKAEEMAAPPATETVVTGSRKVLVVDDHKDAAHTLTLLLQQGGHHAQMAQDGPEALALAASMRPDVVLMDIGLPEMDGYEVARRIRELPGLGDVRLIAVTGYGQETDKQAAVAAGFQLHLVKPVDPDQLARAIAG